MTNQSLEDIFDVCVKTDGGRLSTSAVSDQNVPFYEGWRINGQQWLNALRESPQTTALKTMPYVHFDFISSTKLNAVAFSYEETGSIGINVGTVLLLKDLFNRMLCDPHLQPDIGDISLETSVDLPYLFTDFAHVTNFARQKGIDKLPHPVDEQRQTYADTLFRHAFYFLLAHELAHIRYGHVDLEENTTGSPMFHELRFQDSGSGLTSQTLEMDADSWATTCGINLVRGWIDNPKKSPERYEESNDVAYDSLYDFFFAAYTLFTLLGKGHGKIGDLTLCHPPPRLRQQMIYNVAITAINKYQADLLEVTLLAQRNVFEDVEKAIARLTRIPSDPNILQDWVNGAGWNHINALLEHWKSVVRPQLVPLTKARDLVE